MSCYVGLIGLFCGISALNIYGPRWNAERSLESLMLIGFATLPQVVLEACRVYFFETNKNGNISTLCVSLFSIMCRFVGLIATLFCMGTFYWLFDEYHHSFMCGVFDIDERPSSKKGQDNNDKPYYYNFFRIFGLFIRSVGGWTGITVVLFFYIFVTDVILVSPKDGFYYTGRFIVSPLVPWSQSQVSLSQSFTQANQNEHIRDELQVCLHALKQHALESLVRMFYAPIMFCSLCDNLPPLHIRKFVSLPPADAVTPSLDDGDNHRFLRYFNNYMSFFRFSNNLIFTVDLTFAIIGYLLPGSQLVDTHVRSTEPTLLGWLCAIICYHPFFLLLTDRYIDYGRNPEWTEMFDRLNGQRNASHWITFRVWGTTILILQLIFAWCTVTFGLRYSNLTYRGKVITTGPYYYFQHPAYIVKLVSFALISVPWLDLRGNDGSLRGLRNVLCLLLLCGVYTLRARTEEAHLLQATKLEDANDNNNNDSNKSGSYAMYVQELNLRWGWLHSILLSCLTGLTVILSLMGFVQTKRSSHQKEESKRECVQNDGGRGDGEGGGRDSEETVREMDNGEGEAQSSKKNN